MRLFFLMAIFTGCTDTHSTAGAGPTTPGDTGQACFDPPPVEAEPTEPEVCEPDGEFSKFLYPEPEIVPIEPSTPPKATTVRPAKKKPRTHHRIPGC